MKKAVIVSVIVLVMWMLLPNSNTWAATDGTYSTSETPAVWDGTDANRLKAATFDYNYTYGDEASITYPLPWNFTYYGQSYSQINADTNGNIWFSTSGSAHSFNLSATGRGPVIAAWNNDLSSNLYGGVFIQHKTNPERVVVEWLAETYSDEGSYRPNRFEVVLFQNGSVRLDYKSFAPSTFHDFGSGISQGNGATYISLTNSFGASYALAGHSYGIGQVTVPAVAINPVTPPTTSSVTLSGVVQVESSLSITTNNGATVGQITYPSPTTWLAIVASLPDGTTVVTVTATSPSGQVTSNSIPVTYNSGSGSVAVPAMGPLGVIVTLAGLMMIAYRKQTECGTK
jgi:hypothetical protein